MTDRRRPTGDLHDRIFGLPRRVPSTPDTDWRWVVIIHWDKDHDSPLFGPFKSQTHADLWMTAARKVYREAGLRPPKIERLLLRGIGAAEMWIKSSAERAALAADERRDPDRFLDR